MNGEGQQLDSTARSRGHLRRFLQSGAYFEYLSILRRFQKRFSFRSKRKKLAKLAAHTEESVVEVSGGLGILGQFLGDLECLLGFLVIHWVHPFMAMPGMQQPNPILRGIVKASGLSGRLLAFGLASLDAGGS
jgi:hypothetical protein